MAETLTVYPSSFNSDYKYASVNSSYPTSNPIGKGSTNTTYTQINLTTGSQAETYFYYNFDLSEIPEAADIVSVSCSYKAYISTTNSSYISTRSVQLYSGTTAKGSSGTFSTSITSTSLTAGTWTRAELDNARIRLYAKRGSSRTTNTYYIRFYGATLTISYEDNRTLYTVEVECGDNTKVDVDKTNEVKEGERFEVSTTTPISSITDNNVDVLSLIKQETVAGLIVGTPKSYTVSGSINGTKYQNCIGKNIDNTESGNDYASSSGSTATIYYSFDLSSIPNGVDIESINVMVAGHLESTSSSSEVAKLQLYSGDTPKGSEQSFTSTSKQILTMDAGTWTIDELQDAKLAFTIGYYGGLVNGVNFEVTYKSDDIYYLYYIEAVNENHIIRINMDIADTNLRLKKNGSWIKIVKIYQKQNGSWVEINSSALDSDAIYRCIDI